MQGCSISIAKALGTDDVAVLHWPVEIFCHSSWVAFRGDWYWNNTCCSVIPTDNESLQWRHNERDGGVSNHRRLDGLLNLFCYFGFFAGADQRKLESSAWQAFAGELTGAGNSANSVHKGPMTRTVFPFDDVSWCCTKIMMVIRNYVMIPISFSVVVSQLVFPPPHYTYPVISISCSRFTHTANAICKLINPGREPNIQWIRLPQWYEMLWCFCNYTESTMVGWVVSNGQLLSLYPWLNPSYMPANSRELPTVTGWPLNDWQEQNMLGWTPSLCLVARKTKCRACSIKISTRIVVAITVTS